MAEGMPKFARMVEYGKLDPKPYQRDGVKWCLRNELATKGEIKGGIIADEMGLGKTITMIGTMVGNTVRRSLIVLPVVLLEQWASQIKRLTGHTSLIYHGTHKSKMTDEKLKAATIVLTTYGMITVDKTVPRPTELHKLQWNRVVFDEAHHLRNRATGRYIGASMLKTDIHWFLTGTPIQNKKSDLFSLCTLLGIDRDDCEENMAHIVERYVLRRTKAQVGIKLPDVVEENTMVAWSDEREKALAEEIHSTLSFSGVSAEKSGKIAEHMSGIGPGKSFALLIRARQMCTLPSLLSQSLPENHGYSEAVKQTSKMDAVVQTILSRKGNGNGKLVFCNFRGEIDELARRLQEGGIQKVGVFDGRVTGSQREAILKGGNEVIILQIQTGCEGLNLQEGFSEIYFSSPNWNPAIEDQAIARCHRIGQSKPVSVYRFVMEGFDKDPGSQIEPISIEMHICNTQTTKREIMFSDASTPHDKMTPKK